MVRQSIAGQCSNNSNDLHATLPKVVVIIIVILIMTVMFMIYKNYHRLIHCRKLKANFVYIIFAIHYISLRGNIAQYHGLKL